MQPAVEPFTEALKFTKISNPRFFIFIIFFFHIHVRGPGRVHVHDHVHDYVHDHVHD